MKIAPIIHALQAHKNEDGALDYRLAHTGQHYDARMYGAFFSQLGTHKPDIYFDASTQIVATLEKPLVPTCTVD